MLDLLPHEPLGSKDQLKDLKKTIIPNAEETLLFNGLEAYFRKLKNIKKDELNTLPSGNSFKVTYDGIMFYRQGKEELWKIRAEKTGVGVGLHVDRLEYDPNGWKLRVTAKKMGITVKKEEEPQILDRTEISQIFATIEAGNVYTRPKIRPDGKPYELILEVKRS